MKKTVSLLAVTVGLLTAASVSAATVHFEWPSPHGEDGEFIAVTSDHGTFRTFCLERNEYISYPTTGAYTYTVAAFASNGGVGGGNPDYISKATAWLYDSFLNGGLVGYVSGSAASQNALQLAFWTLENEVDGGNPGGAFNNLAITTAALDYVAAAKVPFGAGWNAAADGLYNVFVMNPGPGVQSMLIRVPSVPDGGMTLGLLAAGVVALGAVRRRLL